MVTARKWEDCLHLEPTDFEKYWANRMRGKKDILLIVGLGWDPRMTALARVFKSYGGDGARHVHLIRYSPSQSFQSPHKKFIERNIQELERVLDKWAEKVEIPISTRREGNLYIGDEEISRYYTGFELSHYDDILVDVSSLPKSLYFTLLLVLVRKCSRLSPIKNVHVIICQDVELDAQITETADDTRLLKGFKGKLRRLSQQSVPIIWAPILERNASIALAKLYDYLGPKDIYPVLPFPCRNPRSDDQLLIEYRSIFVDEWNLNPMNFIYAAEDDPLDIYRSLLTLYEQQSDALDPLGGVSMVVSALSSKVASVGAFMAAYEKKMAIAHAIGRHSPPSSMDLDYWDIANMNRFASNLHSIWLTGEPYAD